MNGFLFIGVEDTQLSSQDIKNLTHPSVAGAVLFSRNYANKAQLHQLCHHIHELRKPHPLKIAVDHEGGRVQRFKLDFTIIPEPESFFNNTTDEAIAKQQIIQYAEISALELRDCGIDINFAPCLDLNWGNSSVMSTRCYHKNPEIVAQCANAFMQTHHQCGVLTTAKHFPGHGFASDDSHHKLPIDNRSFEEMTMDIKAFRQSLVHTKAIMMAHILFPKIDSQIASFSSYWIKTILRQQLGFKGCVFSDDLQMRACDNIGDSITRISLALDAGNNYLIWGNNLPELTHVLNHHNKQLSMLAENQIHTPYDPFEIEPNPPN